MGLGLSHMAACWPGVRDLGTVAGFPAAGFWEGQVLGAPAPEGDLDQSGLCLTIKQGFEMPRCRAQEKGLVNLVPSLRKGASKEMDQIKLRLTETN